VLVSLAKTEMILRLEVKSHSKAVSTETHQGDFDLNHLHNCPNPSSCAAFQSRAP
jgi:deoxyxylulose-5-phosphate synthase